MLHEEESVFVRRRHCPVRVRVDEEATKVPPLDNGKDVNTKKHNSHRKLKGSKRKRRKEKRKRFRKKKRSEYWVVAVDSLCQSLTDFHLQRKAGRRQLGVPKDKTQSVTYYKGALICWYNPRRFEDWGG